MLYLVQVSPKAAVVYVRSCNPLVTQALRTKP